MASGDPGSSFLENKHLYLFEVLVKSVDIKEKLLEPSDREVILKNPLKIRIIFSDFYDVEINEVKDIKTIHLPQPEQVKCHSKMIKMFNNNDVQKGKDDKLNSAKDDNEDINFIRKSSEHSRRAGFSCLFPMNPLALIQKMKTSYLYLMVYGSCGFDNATKVDIQKIIGQAKVAIRSNFIDSVRYALDIDEFPTTASLATTCNVKNIFEEKTGKIEIYVRLSCFGKYIISMFKMMKNNPRVSSNNTTTKVTQQPRTEKNTKVKKKTIKQNVKPESAKCQIESSALSKTKTVSAQSAINQTTSVQSAVNETASPQPTINQTASPQPKTDQTASPQPTTSCLSSQFQTPSQITMNLLNASSQSTMKLKLLSQLMSSPRSSKYQSSSSSHTTVNLNESSQSSKLQSASLPHTTVNGNESPQPTNYLTSRSSKLQSA